MNEHYKYTINSDEFDKMYNRAEAVSQSLILLKSFCENNNSEMLAKIRPVLNFIFKESDLLYAAFINLKSF